MPFVAKFRLLLSRRFVAVRHVLLAQIFIWTAVTAGFADPPEVSKPAEPATSSNKKASETKFLRVQRDANGSPVSLDTAIVRYVPAGDEHPGLSVDLVAAIHVGDATYYEKLNKRFRKYDVLLYELVAPEGTRIPKGGGGAARRSAVGAMQGGMTTVLGLAFQLEAIDYTKENFVHADMSPEEFSQSMKDRGDSFMKMFFRMMGQAMAQQNRDPAGNSDLRLLMALFAKDRELRLKRILAEQFENLEDTMQALEGPEGSTIIAERNKRALSVLAEQIKAGKKQIGIFYGAGHLTGMEEKLLAEFGLRRAKVRWVEAWDLRQ